MLHAFLTYWFPKNTILLVKSARIYCVFFLLLASVRPTVAQVVLDNTLSNGSALPGPNFNIPAELGKTVGVNLFHSFHEFNLQIGESATFTGPDRIQNILSRVTGGNESYIDGLIESKIHGANLYLLNPNGFIFGENSQVSVDGSFTVSTHEGIRFGEGQFNAVDPDKSVLVVSDAKSFGFLGDNPLGDIVLNGGFLSVSGAKQSIALAGNQVTFQDEAYIGSENGGNVDIQASSLAVLSGSEIAVYGSEDHQGGQINISADTIVLDEGGGIYAGSGYDPEQPRGPNGGSINITADSLSVKAGNIDASSEGLGRAGDINILSREIDVGTMEYEEGEWEASISADAVFVGTNQEQELIHSGKWTIDGGGDIKIDSETMDIVNGGIVSSISIGQGDAGSVTINTDNLKLADWAAIGTFTQFRPTGDQDRHIKGGHGGNLTIDAKNIVFSYVSLELGTWGSGDSGAAIINADSLFMELTEMYGDSYGLGYETYRPGQEDAFAVPDESWVFVTGKGPNLTLNIKDITLSESSIDLRSTGAGNAGSLTIHAQHLKLDDESSISSLSAMTGNAGSINIVTDRLDVLGQSKIETSTEYRATNLEELDLVGGLGGDLSIDAKEIYLINGSLDVGTKGSGESGTANIKSDILLMKGGKINADASGESYATENRPTGGWEAFEVSGEDTWQFATGNGPLVEINIGRIELSEESRIDIKATGAGDAGMLSIETDFLELTGESKISSKATKIGDGGAVFIDAEKVLLTDGSEIETLTEYIMPPEQGQEVISAGRGGALFLNAKELTISDGSGMELGTSGTGNSGAAMISSDKVTLTGWSYINGDVKPSEVDDFEDYNDEWRLVTGNGPDIVLDSKEIIINESSNIDIKTEAAGNAGFLSIETDSLELRGISYISSSSSKTGNGGYIVIDTDDLLVEGLSQIETATMYRASSSEEAVFIGGQGGNLTISAENINMKMGAMELGTWGSGESGIADISAKELNLNNGSIIFGDAYGWGDDWQYATGKGPNINLEVESIYLDGESSIDMKSTGAGNAGNLMITSLSLVVDNDSRISSKSSMTGNAGSITINTDTVKLIQGGAIETFTEFRATSDEELNLKGGRGGDLLVDANEIILQRGRMEIGTWGSGDSGYANFVAEKLTLGQGSVISGDAYGLGYLTEDRAGVELIGPDTWMYATGNGPELFLDVDRVHINESSSINMKSTGAGNAGSLKIESAMLAIDDHSKISSKASMTGDAGNIVIDTEKLSLTGDGKIETYTEFRPVITEETNITAGSGGDLVVNAREIVLDHGKMELGTWGNGAGGSATIKADTLTLRNSSMDADAMGESYLTSDRGHLGAVEDMALNADNSELIETSNNLHLAITGEGFFEVLSPWGDGQKGYTRAGKFKTDNKGNLITNQGFELNVGIGQISPEGEFVISSDGKYSVYKSNGEISSTGQIQITRFSNPDALEGVGMGVYVESEDSGTPEYGVPSMDGFGELSQGFLEVIIEKFSNSHEVFEDTWSNAKGKGGELVIDVNNLNVLDRSRLNLSSSSAGDVGSLSIKSAETIVIGDSLISTESKHGNGGAIRIQSLDALKVDSSKITAQAKKDGGSVTFANTGSMFLRDSIVSAKSGQDGGNIFVEAPDTLVLQRSRLSANAIHGHGGYILITADGFLPSIETSITASSEFGVQGTVEIRTPDTDVGSGLVVLPQTLVSKNINLAERCALRLAGDVSSFFMNGQGGVPVWASHSYLPTLIIPELDDANKPSERSGE